MISVGHRAATRQPAVLIVVQNLSVPLDRRVWQESRALVDAGFAVSVICPRGPGERSFELLERVRIHRYRPPRTGPGVVGFAHEFAYCWLATAWLALRIYFTTGFDAIQACNPPDTYWALALPFKLLGVRFVYDQHDLCPEVFDARFGTRRRLLSRVVRLLEQATYRTADRVIATNDSYRTVAVGRGRRDPRTVTIVRSGPHPAEMRREAPVPELRRGAPHLCCYLGIMGPQDGVDLLLRAVADLVHERRRTDVHVALLGFGDCYDDLRALSVELGIDPWVTFTGRADRTVVREYLSTADVGLSPDPCSAFNDVSTMNKVLEYMAHELPVVAFDLKETRVSAGDAAVYVADGDLAGFAAAIDALLDDSEARVEMGRRGRARIEGSLGWHRQASAYVGVYEELVGIESLAPSPVAARTDLDTTHAAEVGR
jgi:glycosyltransferase involved in cell wall biosynthesis